MKTKKHRENKINVVTLGCSKNLVDSEELLGQLQANDIPAAHEQITDANIVVVNTCGFIDNAKQESIDTIIHFAALKERGEIEKLFVTGCLSERYKPELEKEIGNVDAFFGTHDLSRLLKALGADYKHELIGERISTTPAHYAYLKISEGCDRPCSFCAIPLMRGKHKSKSTEDILTEARMLAAKGVKELLIIAQDSTYYGLDIYGKRRLADLLRELTKVEGIEWIRLHYAFPTGFPVDILDVLREEEKVCSYLDMPLQHISTEILKSMRRGTTEEKTNQLIEKIRQSVPGIALRTTLIAGYPGESEEDFNLLASWVRDMKFERLGIFCYSHEENTHAHLLDDDVPAEVKQDRADAIMAIQQENSLQHNESLVGKKLKIIIDKVEGDYFVGRTEFDSPEVDNEVLIPTSGTYLRLGDFVLAEITSAEDYDLYARPI